MRIPFCLSTGGAVQDILSEVDVRDEASVIAGAASGAVEETVFMIVAYTFSLNLIPSWSVITDSGSVYSPQPMALQKDT